MHLVAPNDSVLWTPAAPVTDIAAQVLPHVAAMRAIMEENRGVGLAAPQVGIGLQFFVTPDEVFINPLILDHSSTMIDAFEGCLSLWGYQRVVGRPASVTLTWQEQGGEWIGGRFEGMQARVVLHEIQHLDGSCIFDRPILLDTASQVG